MRGASCVTHGAWDRQRVALFVGPDMAGFRIERQALHSVVTVAVHSGQAVELRFGPRRSQPACRRQHTQISQKQLNT